MNWIKPEKDREGGGASIERPKTAIVQPRRESRKKHDEIYNVVFES
jgi:hypothetical protein